MVAVPADNPFTTPVPETTLTVASPLDQVPPETASVRVIEALWQTLDGPEIEAKALIVMVVVVIQPEPKA